MCAREKHAGLCPCTWHPFAIMFFRSLWKTSAKGFRRTAIGNSNKNPDDMYARKWFWVAALAVAALMAIPASGADAIARKGDAADAGGVQFRDIGMPEPSSYVDISPLAIAVVPWIEFPDETWDVEGFRLNLLVGRHRGFQGLDIGILGNFTSGEMGGVGLAGLFNDVGTSEGGFLLAGAVNHSSWDFTGGQVSGLFSWTEGLLSGMQIAPVNKAGRLDGAQIGALNMSGPGTGLQIGLVNVAERLSGFQIGVVNINRESDLPFMPIVNFSF